MRMWSRRVVVLCALLAGCGGAATPELQLIEDAAEALGSLRAVNEVTGLVLEGQGQTYRLGQNSRPTADLPYYEIANYLLEIDYANRQWRLRQDRTTTFLTGGPLYGVRQVYGLDGDVAYDERGDQTVQASAQVAADRWTEMFHNPVGILLLALDETSTVSNLREEGGQQFVDIVAENGTQLTLGVDAETGFPSRVSSAAYHPNLGDVTLETTFEDYEETGGLGGFQARLTLPRGYATTLGEFLISEYRVQTNTSPELGDLSAPATEPAAADGVVVEVEEIASGVWYLTGGSHHSVVVEFDEYLALIEAPQSEARTLEVIERARELQPDKPLRYLVNTHHHFDHSAGVRAAVSEGLTVLTHQVNEAFFEEAVVRQHSIQQDALARNPQPLTIEAVSSSEPYELSSGRRTLQLFHLADDLHSDGMVVAYLVRERILVEADAFSPSAQASPFAAALLHNIEDRGLRIDTILPLHGSAATLEDLESAVQREQELR